jgi:hypothetical protein
MQIIPIIDIRNGSPADLLKSHSDKAVRLVEASKNTFGIASRAASYVALPIGDRLSKKWLEKTNNPYLSEIEQYSKLLGIRGIYALNMCYEWGCTSGVYSSEQNTALIRVLDWPFPALGENIVVAHQTGIAGDFYNVTWPGVSGIFQATAPRRFSAALNQAPMRRYKTGIVIDWVRNRGMVHKNNGLPPAHLLRKVFETAKNYQDARKLLSEEPVSIPVIFTLSGLTANEGCVIERLEDKVSVREINKANVCAANHFESELNGIGHGWLPRAVDSHGRSRVATSLNHSDLGASFKWFKPPVANPLSRLVMQADASSGKFSVMGTDGINPVTEIFTL